MTGASGIEPMVRAGNAAAMPRVLAALGLDLPKLLDAAGLPADAWADPEQLLSGCSLIRLANLAEAYSGCDHIGLLIGIEDTDLGLPAFLLSHAPDLQTGLRDLVELYSLMNEGGRVSLDLSNDMATLRYTNLVPMLTGAQHFVDCILAQIHKAMAKYCTPHFNASEIRFPRRRPADPRPYVNHFGRARLVFDAEEAAILFPASFLAHCSEKADPNLYLFLRRGQRSSNLDQAAVVVRTKHALRLMLPEGDIGPDKVAEIVGLHPRTLRWRLRQDGTSLRSLIALARYEAAIQLLTNTDMPVGKIAHVVGYSDASALSRAVATRSGKTPTAFREKTSVRAERAKGDKDL